MKKRRALVRIPRGQWRLPAGVHVSTGRAATLRDVLDPKVPTRSFAGLSRKRQSEIIAARIRGQKRFRLWIFGLGQVSRRRAVLAVQSRDPLGQALIELDRSILATLEEEGARRRKPRGRRSPA
jgi:hypothetical protein